jgi:hypothetical protein
MEGKSREEVFPKDFHTALFEGRPQFLVFIQGYREKFWMHHLPSSPENTVIFHSYDRGHIFSPVTVLLGRLNL